MEVIRQDDVEGRKWDRKSVTEANGLLQNIYSSSFLVTLSYTQFLLGFTSISAKLLQIQIMSVIKVHAAIKLSITELQNVRSNAKK